jgi:hypothetical protein
MMQDVHSKLNPRLPWQKQHSTRRRLFTSKLHLNLRKKLVKCCIWSIALYGAETWTLQKLDQKLQESFEMWCWRMMEKISWTNRVRNKEVLQRVKEERNILQRIKRRKANWIGHILHTNCLLKHVIEGKIEGRIEMTGRRGRRHKQLLDNLKDKRGYWKLRGDTKSHSVENSLWKRLQTYRKTDKRMNG